MHQLHNGYVVVVMHFIIVQLIRDEIHAGKSDKEIYKKLEEDFGETVLYAPKFDLQTAGLWLSPVSWWVVNSKP